MPLRMDELRLTALVGSTPVFVLETTGAQVWIKIEGNNPGGSIKDRAAWGMLRRAETAGLITKNTVIVEPTSGNTGIALAMYGAAMGLHVILTMPESMSPERRAILSAFGARLELTPTSKGMTGSVEKAQAIAAETPGALFLDQFSNPGNPWAHEMTTGPELLNFLRGRAPYAFVAGVGTGGTLSGTGRVLKRTFPKTRVIAVEPAESPMISRGRSGPHEIQGIGANFVPANLDISLIDSVITVPSKSAVDTARELAKKSGLFWGISAGANVRASIDLAMTLAPDEIVVTVAPDRGDRYLGILAGS